MLRKLVIVSPFDLAESTWDAFERLGRPLDENGEICATYRKVFSYAGPPAAFSIVVYDDQLETHASILESLSEELLMVLNEKSDSEAPAFIGRFTKKKRERFNQEKVKEVYLHRNWVYMPDFLEDDLVEALWKECERYREAELLLEMLGGGNEAEREELERMHLNLEAIMNPLQEAAREAQVAFLLALGHAVGGITLKGESGPAGISGVDTLKAILEGVRKAK